MLPRLAVCAERPLCVHQKQNTPFGHVNERAINYFDFLRVFVIGQRAAHNRQYANYPRACSLVHTPRSIFCFWRLWQVQVHDTAELLDPPKCNATYFHACATAATCLISAQNAITRWKWKLWNCNRVFWKRKHTPVCYFCERLHARPTRVRDFIRMHFECVFKYNLSKFKDRGRRKGRIEDEPNFSSTRYFKSRVVCAFDWHQIIAVSSFIRRIIRWKGAVCVLFFLRVESALKSVGRWRAQRKLFYSIFTTAQMVFERRALPPVALSLFAYRPLISPLFSEKFHLLCEITRCYFWVRPCFAQWTQAQTRTLKCRTTVVCAFL